MTDNTPHSFSGLPTSGGQAAEQRALEPENPTFSGQVTAGDTASSAALSSRIEFESVAEDLDDIEIEIVDLSSRYELQGSLGQGGMGEVQRAIDRHLRRLVAIKRVLGTMAGSRQALGRFLTEARSIAAISHFNIVQVYDYGRDRTGPFLILEYVDGPSLHDKLRTGPLGLDQALEITCQLCDGLALAHERGIIHRDIKPANILLTGRGEPKLTDFGLARQEQAGSDHTVAGAVLGTLDYMPPEQRRDATQVDGRSDLWSLAATLYQMVTCESPRVMELDRLPASLRPILAKALKTKPDERYQTALELRTALRECQRQTAHPLGPVAIGRIQPGQCRSCCAVNEVSRKFCAGCGSVLIEPCLQCHQPTGVWETFCGACGGNQSTLAVQRDAELNQAKQDVATLRRAYRYEDALAIAERVAALDHPRLEQHRAWAQHLAADLQRELGEQRSQVTRLLDEARAELTKYDYAAVQKLLESIPEEQRIVEVRDLLATVVAAKSEAAQLVKVVKEAVKNKQWEGLHEKTRRLLELRPDRADVRKLHCQLEEREAHRQNELAPPQTKAPSQRRWLPKSWPRFAGLAVAAVIMFAGLTKFGLVSPLVSESGPGNSQAGSGSSSWAGSHAGEIKRLRLGEIDIPLAWCPLGKFVMGSPIDEAGRDADEDQVTVELTRGFWLGQTEVTQELYQSVMRTNPSGIRGTGSQRPVEQVSFDDAIEFCSRLTTILQEQQALLPEWRVTLPTEAQWEYACRAGTTTTYHFGPTAAELSLYAWTRENSRDETHDVGLKRPNKWGLYDMHGNVSERCADWFGKPLQGGRDPIGPPKESSRVDRGGSWAEPSSRCRSAYRNGNDGTYRTIKLGFRFALIFSD